MAGEEHAAQAAAHAKLRNSTTVFLVGNIEQTMEWYKRLEFKSEYYPPGFAILRRDEIEIFLQGSLGTWRQMIRDGRSATRGTCTSSRTI